MAIDEIVIGNDFEKSETELKIFESMKDLNFPQECDSDFPIIIILDDIKRKDKKHPRFQARIYRFRHNIKSIFKISQEF